MDEPTNHVDIAGQEQLEAEILEHGASCILVSHDRSFVRNIGTRFLEIAGNKVREVDSPEGFFQQMERFHGLIDLQQQDQLSLSYRCLYFVLGLSVRAATQDVPCQPR